MSGRRVASISQLASLDTLFSNVFYPLFVAKNGLVEGEKRQTSVIRCGRNYTTTLLKRLQNEPQGQKLYKQITSVSTTTRNLQHFDIAIKQKIAAILHDMIRMSMKNLQERFNSRRLADVNFKRQ